MNQPKNQPQIKWMNANFGDDFPIAFIGIHLWFKLLPSRFCSKSGKIGI